MNADLRSKLDKCHTTSFQSGWAILEGPHALNFTILPDFCGGIASVFPELALRIFESISNRAGGLLGSIRVRNYRSRAEQTSCSIRGRGHVEHGICVQARFESNSNRTGVG